MYFPFVGKENSGSSVKVLFFAFLMQYSGFFEAQLKQWF